MSVLTRSPTAQRCVADGGRRGRSVVYSARPRMDSVNVNMEPPPYEEACSMPPMNAENRSALNHPDLYQKAPQRGVLASKGSVVWWRCGGGLCGLWRSQGQQGRHIHPLPIAQPGPPGPPECIIEARKFKCGVCSNVSFVRQEQVGTYIKCPHCKEICTINTSKTRRVSICLFIVAILTALLFVVCWTAILNMEESRYKGHHVVIFPISLTAVLLKRAWDYHSIPRGSLEDGYVPYLPSIFEIAMGMTTGTGEVYTLIM